MAKIDRGDMVAFLLSVMLCVLIGVSAAELQRPTRVEWVMEGCGTLDCVTALLNTLGDRAIDAKVTTINSQRSFLGPLTTPYYVWHRK